MLIQVPVEKLEIGMVAQQDVLSAAKGALILKKGTKLSKSIIGRLSECGVEYVLVEATEEYLKNNPLAETPAPADHMPSEASEEVDALPRSEAFNNLPRPDIDLPEITPLIDKKLREAAVNSIRNMFRMANESKTTENMTTAYIAIKEIEDVVDKLIDTLSEEEHSLIHIADLKSYDEYTYHHSLSVAVLSIAIGQSMGLSEHEIRMLGKCAMLHDIGKIFIPSEIINKTSSLTDEEFEIIKGHSRHSFEFIAKWSVGDVTLRLGVLSHHEKVDGTGYPNGLAGDEIPLLSKIISVADVYDAVTSYRSYRSPMPPAEAVDLVMSQIGTAFDYEVVRVFIAKLMPYPINTCIELSNKRFGIVIDNKYPMRPVIQMTDNGEVVDLLGLQNLSIMIVRIVD